MNPVHEMNVVRGVHSKLHFGPDGTGTGECLPLYHCCNSFLSKCVDLERSSSCAGDNLDCLS